MRGFIIAGVLACPALAAANPITIGASIGLTQDQVDADAGNDATQTLGLWGRLGFSSRVAGQLELSRFESKTGCDTCTVGTYTDIRTGTALLVVDLAEGSHWMPMLVAGLGLDRDDGSIPTRGHHIEGGLGLEYRGDGGITLGVDARLGSRTLDGDVVLQGSGSDVIAFVPPSKLQEGDYQSLRLTLGVRF